MTTTQETTSIIVVDREVMNAAFSRAAGRYCEHCDMNGSHHSDRHNEFAEAALAAANK